MLDFIEASEPVYEPIFLLSDPRSLSADDIVFLNDESELRVLASAVPMLSSMSDLI
jgi:hypothetical protein